MTGRVVEISGRSRRPRLRRPGHLHRPKRSRPFTYSKPPRTATAGVTLLLRRGVVTRFRLTRDVELDGVAAAIAAGKHERQQSERREANEVAMHTGCGFAPHLGHAS